MQDTLTVFGGIVLAMFLCTAVVIVWNKLMLKLSRPEELPPTRWCCPFKGPEDFSGGYRDNPLEDKQCHYVLEMYTYGDAKPRCPNHHVDLVPVQKQSKLFQ